MTQRDRDRLVALKKAKKGVITQRQAAKEMGQSERHVRRLLKQLKIRGDKAIVHALRGRRSNRKVDEKLRQTALEILGRKVYAGFGPTLAAEPDDRRQAMAGPEAARREDPPLAGAPVKGRRVGAMGHQRARLAGRPRAKAV
jgi:hypothetical protein